MPAPSIRGTSSTECRWWSWAAAPAPDCDREADRLYWEAVKNETSPGYFEAYLKRVESGELCGLFADIARLKLEARVVVLPSMTEPTPQEQSAPAETDPAAAEAALTLRPEDRIVVQEALTSVDFDTRGTDGVFGANTRRAIAGWQRSRSDKPTGYLTASQYGALLADAEPKLAALAVGRQKPEQPSPAQPAVGVYEQQSQYRPGDEFRDCNECPLMVVVPGGSFMMGSTEAERQWAVGQGAERARVELEKPQHRVAIPEPFAVGKYEVTFDEWDACVEEGGCNGYKPRDEGWGRRLRPVINVSWKDAKAYVEWLSEKTGKLYRLPSEAEWEYVARAGTTTRYWWGDAITRKNANYGGYLGKTAEVGSYPPNPWGLYDIHGNVWEWGEDCIYNSYVGAPDDGSAWTIGGCGGGRMGRGGAWNNIPWLLRSASRGWTGPDTARRDKFEGFRVARTVTP